MSRDDILWQISFEKQYIFEFSVFYLTEAENAKLSTKNDFNIPDLISLFIRLKMGLEVKGLSPNHTNYTKAGTSTYFGDLA